MQNMPRNTWQTLLNLTHKELSPSKIGNFFVKGREIGMKKLIMTLATMMLLMTGCGMENDSRETIIVGFDESPLGYRNEKGEIVGFEIDLAREAIERAGAKPEFKIIHWNEKEIELNSGKIDMIWNGMDISKNQVGITLSGFDGRNFPSVAVNFNVTGMKD